MRLFAEIDGVLGLAHTSTAFPLALVKLLTRYSQNDKHVNSFLYPDKWIALFGIFYKCYQNFQPIRIGTTAAHGGATY